MKNSVAVCASLALMFASVAGAAGFSLEKVRAIAAEIGAPAPEAQALVVVPQASAVPAPAEVVKEEVAGEGMLEGTASVSCSDYGTGAGAMHGIVSLKGEVLVSAKSGAKGKIFVSGGGFLDGFCHSPFGGTASGFVNVKGKGALVGADGQPAGTAEVKGQTMVSVHSSGGTVWVSVPMSVKGVLAP